MVGRRECFRLSAVKDLAREAHNQFFGAPFAMPAMGEKGYLDIKVSCRHAEARVVLMPDHRRNGRRSELLPSYHTLRLMIALLRSTRAHRYWYHGKSGRCARIQSFPYQGRSTPLTQPRQAHVSSPRPPRSSPHCSARINTQSCHHDGRSSLRRDQRATPSSPKPSLTSRHGTKQACEPPPPWM